MIPKLIHYCWFGNNPKPKLAEKCIKSWKKKCPDYEIKEWNENNFDISSAPLYVQQAYEAKKWAFVTDYVRLYAMTKYGGIYMDTDVEVIRSLNKFLHHHAFSGFEDGVNIPTGIMACEKDFPLFRQFLDYYNNVSFILPDGTVNLTTNVTTMTKICLERGLKQDNSFQIIDGFALYPKDVFCPVSYKTGELEKTKNTVTIHWFASSWKTQEQRDKHNAFLKEQKKIRRKITVHKMVHLPNRILLSILGKEKYEYLKKVIKR